jgi:hypothetical protein
MWLSITSKPTITTATIPTQIQSVACIKILYSLSLWERVRVRA